VDLPKYSKLERERRWLVQSSVIQELAGLPYYEIGDLYLKCGRLRLRAMVHSVTQERQFKLCKKYGQISSHSEPIVNIYLTSDEHAALTSLDGFPVHKRRYKKRIQDIDFSIDVFQGALSGLVICEKEAQSEEELQSFPFPYADAIEITGDHLYSGGALARLEADDVTMLLAQRFVR
jgi:CYTH domain-containing protein